MLGFCYMFGMIGNLKGVLYLNCLIVLYVYGVVLFDVMNLFVMDVVLFVVLMFYVNVWGLLYVVLLMGGKLVLLGKDFDGKLLYELMEVECVMFFVGVLIVWFGLLNYMCEVGVCFLMLNCMVIGGFVCLFVMLCMFEDEYGVCVIYVWGMIELLLFGMFVKFNWV